MQMYVRNNLNYTSMIQLIITLYIHLALSLVSDKEKLLKEVTTMLSFKHPNVMSLIGVCFDGEMPLIIMPYMSNGSVLGYVKHNKGEILLDSQANVEEVCNSLPCVQQLLLLSLITGGSCKKMLSWYLPPGQ